MGKPEEFDQLSTYDYAITILVLAVGLFAGVHASTWYEGVVQSVAVGIAGWIIVSLGLLLLMRLFNRARDHTDTIRR